MLSFFYFYYLYIIFFLKKPAKSLHSAIWALFLIHTIFAIRGNPDFFCWCQSILSLRLRMLGSNTPAHFLPEGAAPPPGIKIKNPNLLEWKAGSRASTRSPPGSGCSAEKSILCPCFRPSRVYVCVNGDLAAVMHGIALYLHSKWDVSWRSRLRAAHVPTTGWRWSRKRVHNADCYFCRCSDKDVY